VADETKSQRTARLQQVGKELRDARKAAELKQDDVAQRIGVSPITVSRWERGAQEMSFGDFKRYMEAIGAPDFVFELYDPANDKASADQSLAAQLKRRRREASRLSLDEHAQLAKLEEFARRVQLLVEELGLPPLRPAPTVPGIPVAQPEATYAIDGAEVVEESESAMKRRPKGQGA
jgi:transcriptional regulator with XRE-family HTH domain